MPPKRPRPTYTDLSTYKIVAHPSSLFRKRSGRSGSRSGSGIGDDDQPDIRGSAEPLPGRMTLIRSRRSGSMPVNARTSVDLPWSTWPAMPMIATLLPECGDEDVGNCQIVFGINDGARVENKAPVVDTADYCGSTPPETLRERRR